MFYYLHCDSLKSVDHVSINCGDRGLLYGFSLFETMLVQRGRLVMLHRHLERLYGSAGELGINLPANAERMAVFCREAVEKSALISGVLRVTATAGPEKGGHGIVFFTVRGGTTYRRQHYEKGFALAFLSFPRNESSPLVRHKTANYLENLLGRREATGGGYNEGIFLNTRGNVAEGTVSNIFVVHRGEIITPPPEAGLLPGTVRQLVIEKAGYLGHSCREDNLTAADVEQADECFLTNSLMGIMPATSINGSPVGDGTPGPVTRDLMRVYPTLENWCVN